MQNNKKNHINNVEIIASQLIHDQKFIDAYELLKKFPHGIDSNYFAILMATICLKIKKYSKAKYYSEYINSNICAINSTIDIESEAHNNLIDPRPPKEAISFLKKDRFDILAKLIFIEFYHREIKSSWGESVYAAHLLAWNGFKETKPIKSSLKDYIVSFIKIINDIGTNNFDFNKSPILVDDNEQVLDGSHRLAASIYFNKKIRYKYISETNSPEYLYKECLSIESNRVYLKNGVCPFYMFTNSNNYKKIENHHKTNKQNMDICYTDAMALKYAQIKKPNIYSLIIYPTTNETHHKELIEIIEQHSDIIYYKKLKLSGMQAKNLIIQAYNEEDWIGNVTNNFIGSDIQKSKCFTNDSCTRYFMIESNNLKQVLLLKDKIRKLFDIGKHSVHTSDTFNETWRISTTILNQNSLFMNNYITHKNCSNFFSLFEQLKHWVKKNKIDTNEFCITGSSVLSLFGIRDANDIDYICRKGLTLADTNKIKSHLSEEKYYHIDFDDIIYNPNNHFYYDGFKFATLDVISKFKIKRSEPKDIKDLNLLKQNFHKADK